MATRKDQLHSHQFLGQRMVSALVTGETDPEQPPFRRPFLAAIGGLVIALIALAVVAVYGLVVPGGNKAWQAGDAVIVEKETGTRYVFLSGRLHPVANYASAVLALGKKAEARRVSQRSLQGAPRGPRIGILDAPDALPAAKQLLVGAWTLCSQPMLDQTGEPTSESVLLVGSQPLAAKPLATGALLVDVIGTRDKYLIANGFRYQVDKTIAVQAGLTLGAETSVHVGQAFVNGLPEGQPLTPLRLAGLGKPSSAVPGRKSRIGEVFMVRSMSGSRQYYVAIADRLVMMSELQAAIQLAYTPMKAAYGGKAPTVRELNPTSLGRVQPPADPMTAGTDGRLPQSRPDFAKPGNDSTVCAVYAPGSAVPTILVDAQLPPRDPAMITPKRGPEGTALADRVVVPPGTAAVAEVMPSTRTPAGTLVVVTDVGRAYPLIDPDLLKLFGYDTTQPVRFPAGLVARIPQGPGLDPVRALRPTI
ncbi:type VII secretion protein EccB [Kribbella antibiotica]|uniref:Type VII secretion protein EccB n=1 Tax=Kribbella antibiotica TaxID=190195 RepID=A0A4R4ZS03_9ACTN|nr:type VII secretion protein EccB [Kribbella antibiotica]TDD61783.1 type VII secretion protein EccB [Kribbella antibiotica]